jgi:CRISPR-associated endonuclease/helicase Cas3
MREPSDAFGKLQRDENGAISAWHPLVEHMTDVAACFACLGQCRAIRRAMEHAARRKLQPRDISRLAVLVFLHDLGKANSGFQAKRWTKDALPQDWPRPAGHGIEATKIFSDEDFACLVDLLPVDAICTWGNAVEPLLKASISHHGRPIIESSADWNRAIWKPVIGQDGKIEYDPALVLQEIGGRVVSQYAEAFEPGGEALPEPPAFGHLFAGMVQLADWLGSHTGFFPYSDKAEIRAATAPKYAAKAIAALGLDADPWRGRLDDSSTKFAQIFGNPPYAIQSAVGDPDLKPLVILESETGSGKTEAALWHFIHLFYAGKVDSLYFALPTRVSATQVYQRTKATVARLWATEAPLTVRALPGYVSADGQEPHLLPNFRVLWPDLPDDEVSHRRWAAESPKRFLAAPIAVGTIDQALFGALQIRHAHLRHALLARSLLVVDEVHASDPYMTVLLEHLLKAHLGCGGHALLLSATLGSCARDRYLALAATGEGVAAFAPPFEAACEVPYPAISDSAGIRTVPTSNRSKTVLWSLHDSIDDPGWIARVALDAASEGAKVLVVRNTVPAAVALLQAFEAQDPDPAWLFSLEQRVTLHHSRFSRQDRPLLDAAVVARFGKIRPPGPCIVIGTQTLEQSLDLDADLLITDLCPMDVLLQRTGRLHRHARPPDQRPASFRSAQAWVLTPANHDLSPMLSRPRHGLGRFREGGGVYADLRIAETTRRLIDEHPTVSIPDENRYLVEAATHPERLHAVEDALGGPWRRLAQQVQGDVGAQQVIGRMHALEIDKAFDEQPGFPDNIDIATRLGVRDRLVVFDPAPTGPFGEPLRELPIRHYLLPPALDPDTQPTELKEQDGAIEFALETARFRYSRLGLERLKRE